MAKPEPLTLAPFKAVVSPCSECQNYKTAPAEGLPMCPRRMWAEQKERFKNEQDVPEPSAYLTASGTDAPDKFANPVYSKEQQTILVWVAPIQDNRGALDRGGAFATGNILNRFAFDTRYIRCHTVPFLPEEHWAELLVKGAYKEWDRLLVTPVKEEQEQGAPNAIQLPEIVHMGGFARKVNFTFDCPQTAPKADRIVSGG
jgi:hypothetical protein